MAEIQNWFLWAFLSAVFASLTANFAKVGLEGVDSDLAALIRTVIILAVLAGFLYATGKWSNPFELPARTWWFLILSGLATGASCLNERLSLLRMVRDFLGGLGCPHSGHQKRTPGIHFSNGI